MILRYRTVPEQPWRNGRGVTRELLVGQGWRLSVATIAEAGDFSVFEGLDRVFTVARGTVRLEVGGVVRTLGVGDQARFAGEDPVVAEPLGGAAVAVNVMATRGVCRAEAVVGRVDGPLPAGDAVVVLDREVGAGGEVLGPFDALVPSGDGRGLGALVVTVRVLDPT